MRVSFWINNSTRNEIRTLGTFAWVWHEGDWLRAGQGPNFGNDDAGGQLLATMVSGYWQTVDGLSWTDLDIQKEPELSGIEKLAECAGYTVFSPAEMLILKDIVCGDCSGNKLFEGGDYTYNCFNHGLSREEMDVFLQKLE